MVIILDRMAIRVNGMKQQLFNRLYQKALNSIVPGTDDKFGIVELRGEWNFDRVMEFDRPVVVRDCTGFLTFKRPLDLVEASIQFQVNFNY